MSYKFSFPDNWIESTLNEYCVKVADGTHDSPKRSEHGKPLVTSKNIVGGVLDISNTYKISEDDFLEINKRSKVDVGDVLLSMIGTVGQVCLIEEYPDFAIKNVGLLKNKDHLKAKWLYFYLCSPQAQEQIKERLRGTTQQYLSLGEIRKFPIVYPSNSSEMDSIVSVLDGLHKKIQINRQINQTLEQMAQAIFQSWFVDFEPVKAKIAARADWQARRHAQENQKGQQQNAQQAAQSADDDAPQYSSPACYAHEFAAAASAVADQPDLITAMNRAAMCAISGKTDADLDAMPAADYQRLYHTASLFPDELVDSELGEIPKGWEVVKIEDVIARLSVGKKFSQKTVSPEGNVPVLDQGKSGVIGFHNEEPGVNASVREPVIVFANHTCYMRLIMYPFSAIQNVLPFKGNELNTLWTYFATQGKQEFVEYKGHWPDFVIKQIVKPDSRLAEIFSKKIMASMELIYKNELQSEVVTKLRDTLLPKLLSGELDCSSLTD